MAGCQHLSAFYTMSHSKSCHIESTEVQSKNPTGIPVSLDTPQIFTPRYDTGLESGKKCLLSDMILFLCLSLCLLCFSFLLAFFFTPPSFNVSADSPAVGFSHISQSGSLLIPRPDLKGSLKDESLYTVPDFVK